ncbi:MAG: hypothetical protein SCABRO_03398 [Candidatus Scalindua brodae]|uniref:Uncharacterized protein n=1 Tax=Candidatus Scalindua brodae TaxID=237368 RepID=A0A0B0EE41_9BACT|nr:MAG: hypothetical protein SCABRO_03398 [Candidatus Scalindua brodae]
MNVLPIDYQRLLKGYYEAERLPRDFSPERIVPDFSFNVLNPMGLLYKPVVDDNFLENGGKKPIWPNDREFAVCLTHDVDLVSLYSLKEFTRARWKGVSGNKSALKRFKNILGMGMDRLRYKGIKDPLHCYEKWLNVEADMNAHSTFFFLAWCAKHYQATPDGLLLRIG